MPRAASGRLFYAEGDYLHDMDLGFFDSYRIAGGELESDRVSAAAVPDPFDRWVLGAWQTHATSVSASGSLMSGETACSTRM